MTIVPDTAVTGVQGGTPLDVLESTPVARKLELLESLLALEPYPTSGADVEGLDDLPEDSELEAEFERCWPRMEGALLAAMNEAAEAKQDLAPSPVVLPASIASLELEQEFQRQAHRALEEYLCDPLEGQARCLEAMGWNDVAIHLPDPQGRVLERVVASDVTTAYAVRHPIKGPAGLLIDIEADVYRRGDAERIVGGRTDPRYNQYLYKERRHDRFLDRCFTALRLARSVGSWAIDQRAISWERTGDRYVPTVPKGYRLQTIGTLSVSNRTVVSDQLVRETLAHVSREVAPVARSATMAGLAENLLTLLKQATGAKHGVIHVGHNVEAIFTGRAHRIKLAGSVDINSLCGGVADLPRADGIGAEAVALGRPLLIGRAELAHRNPKLVAIGVQACLVAPLVAASGKVIGIAYFHFDSPPRELPPASIYATCGAILGTALLLKQPWRLREYVLAEAKSFSVSHVESVAERAQRLAHFANNLLGSAHVSIRVDQVIRHAGRYLARPGAARGVPALRALNDALRALPPITHDTFVGCGSGHHAALRRGSFAEEQCFEATVAMPLVHEGQVIGSLWVDHHAVQEFPESERQLYRNLRDVIQAGIVAARVQSDHWDPVLAAALVSSIRLDVLSSKGREGLAPSDVLCASYTPDSGIMTEIMNLPEYEPPSTAPPSSG